MDIESTNQRVSGPEGQPAWRMIVEKARQLSVIEQLELMEAIIRSIRIDLMASDLGALNTISDSDDDAA